MSEANIQFVPEAVALDAAMPEAVALDAAMPEVVGSCYSTMALTGLVQSLCTSLKRLRKGKCLILPIKKMNNISVEVSIVKDRKSTYILNISSTYFNLFSMGDDSLYENIYSLNSDDATRELSEDDFILHVVKDSLASLKNVKIDKLNGRFVTAPPCAELVKIVEMWAEFCQEFKDDENMVLSLNECCVCFTVTKTTTNCGHAVCLECISKLQTEVRADDMMLMRNVNHVGCPMCRQRILFLN